MSIDLHGLEGNLRITQGIIHRKRPFGIFNLITSAWEETRIIIDNRERKLYIGSGAVDLKKELDLIGAQVQQLEPKVVGGKMNAFQIRHKVKSKKNKSGWDYKFENTILRAQNPSEMLYWMNAIKNASNGATQRDVLQQQELDETREEISALMADDEWEKASLLFVSAVRIVEKNLSENSIEMATHLLKLSGFVTDKRLSNPSLVTKFKNRLKEAALIYRDNGKMTEATACELECIKLYIFSLDIKGAIQALLKLLAVMQQREGIKNETVVKIMEMLGECHMTTYYYVQAVSYVEQALNIGVKLYGTVHRRTAALAEKLGNVYMAVQRYRDAAESFEIAQRILTKVCGPICMETLTATAYLGAAWMNTGNVEKSKKALAVAEEWSVLNRVYSLAAFTQMKLAEVFLVDHLLEKSLSACESAMYSLSVEQQSVAPVMLTKARVYLALNDSSQAVHYFAEAIAEGDAHDVQFIQRVLDVGIAYRSIHGKEEEGKALIIKAMGMSDALERCPIDWVILAAQADELRGDDLEGAISLYQKALEIKKSRGNHDKSYAFLSMKLGTALIDVENIEEATLHFQEAGAIFIQAGQYEQAGMAYLRIGQNQAGALCDLEGAKKSLEQCRRCLESSNMLPYCLYEIARLCLVQERWMNAIEATSTGLSQILGTEGNGHLTATLLVMRGDAYCNKRGADEQSFKQALSDYDMAAVQLSSNPQPSTVDGSTLIKTEKWANLTSKDVALRAKMCKKEVRKRFHGWFRKKSGKTVENEEEGD